MDLPLFLSSSCSAVSLRAGLRGSLAVAVDVDVAMAVCAVVVVVVVVDIVDRRQLRCHGFAAHVSST